MDSMLLAALFGLAGTFGGIFLGNWLARDNSRREREAAQLEREKEQQSVHRNLRTLLSMENQHNLDGLAKFWDGVNKLDQDVSYSPGAQVCDAERKFSTLPMPEWGEVIWTGNASRLADRLKDEQEVRECYRLNTNVHKLTALRQAMVEKLEWIETTGHKGVGDAFDAWKRSVRVSGQAPTDRWESAVEYFREQSWDLWTSILLLHEEIVLRGNPVAADEAIE
jgi:hypothetical protein